MITAEILKSMTGTVGKILSVSYPSDVADCVNDAVVRALSAIDTFDLDKGSLSSWCCQIARNTAINWCKAHANRGHDSEATSGDEGDTESLVDSLVGSDGRAEVSRRSEAAWLAQAIETLDDDSQMFLMGLADGMGQTEAGALVGWSPATTTRRYRTIVEDLADEMA
jgi:RNA polymerase sigma factor (sigma-70 family)